MMEVPTLASHNSFTYPDDNIEWLSLRTVLLQNQILNISEQLKYGIRTFLIDIYTNKNDPNAPIKLSHGSCGSIIEKASYTRSWVPFLEEIEKFLSNNPNEIITLCLESCVEDYSKIMRDVRQAKLDCRSKVEMSAFSNVKMSSFEVKNEDIKHGYRGTYYYESTRSFTVAGYRKA